MKKYKIPISWEIGSELEIEANSIEEALEKAQNEELPSNGEYIDGSYEIWDDVAREINEE
mgnify:CR=1 FL=1